MDRKEKAEAIDNYLQLLDQLNDAGYIAIARKLLCQGESEPAFYRYLTINCKLPHIRAIEIIRQINDKS
ncbi:MAG: hypothetical protein HC819_01505 [Cyclobacteriaceae bacterium]|nr:hypothetical protein [Cyclobacteriaceae bacterium]